MTLENSADLIGPGTSRSVRVGRSDRPLVHLGLNNKRSAILFVRRTLQGA